MNESHESEVERLVTSSFDRHASALGRTNGSLDDVLRRVDRHRNRRRSIAVIGSSVTLVGVAVGLLALADNRADDARDAAAAPTDSTVHMNVPTTTSPPGASAWRCTGEIGRDMGDVTVAWFEQCELAPFPDHVEAVPEATSPMPFATTTIVVVPNVYEVQPGDSLSGIAEAFGLQPVVIARFNNWVDGLDHVLRVGEKIEIPPPAVDAAAVDTTMAVSQPTVVGTIATTTSPPETAASSAPVKAP